MPVQFNRDAIRQIMDAAANRARTDEEATVWMSEDEAREYLRMTPEEKKAFWEAPLPPDQQAVLDAFREKLLDDMPNVTPRKK